MNGEGIFIEDYLSPKNYARCFVYICPILTRESTVIAIRDDIGNIGLE